MVQFIRDSTFMQNVVYMACVQRMFESELTYQRFL